MNFLEQESPVASQFVRGGRLRKTSKGLVSFAPFLVGALALASGILLATTSPVEAGSCSEDGATGMWTCTGAAATAPDTDGTVNITARADQDINITGDATFGLLTDGSGLQINVHGTIGSGDINIDLSNNNDITSNYSPIFLRRGGSGAVTITTNGTLSSTGGRNGAIFVRNDAPAAVTITSTGTLSSAREGIDIHTGDNPAGEISITANNIMASATGILIGSMGSSARDAVTITTTGTVTSNTQEAIRVSHSGAADVNITTAGTMTASAATKDAINVNHTGTGNIIITVNGSIVGGANADDINLSTASGNATIILGTNASFTRGIDVSGVMGTTSLEIGGTGDRSFTIDNILTTTSNRNFNKNGGHTLTLMGTHASGDAFEQTNINEGKLVWGGTEFRTTGLTVANGATLGITGNSSFTGTSIALSGRLELTGNSASITIDSLTGDNNSDIDIDVDFSGGDATLTSARLTATSVTGTIPVNIRSVNAFQVPDGDDDGAITLENFLAAASSSAFSAGDALDNGNFSVELVHDAANNRWSLVARPSQSGDGGQGGDDGQGDGVNNRNGGEMVVGNIKEALYESLPSVLAQLASLESYQQRLQGRRHSSNEGVWARASAQSNEFEPDTTTLATYESEHAAFQFGIDVPLHINQPSIPGDFAVGASVAFGDATTDVTAGNQGGEIATSTFKASVSTNWEYDDVYVDGQLQYAIFGNEVKSDVKLANENATAYSAGLELGYGFDIEGFRVVPSAQLTWTSIDFGDFKDTTNTEIVLDDGTVLTGRAGIGVEYAVADILLRGNADALMSVDGDVNTRVDGVELTSEREDPAFDVGIGATYKWDDAYTFSADISTQQGGEVEGYAGSVGLKYTF